MKYSVIFWLTVINFVIVNFVIYYNEEKQNFQTRENIDFSLLYCFNYTFYYIFKYYELFNFILYQYRIILKKRCFYISL